MPHIDTLTVTVTGERTQISSALVDAIVRAESQITAMKIKPLKTEGGIDHVRFGTISVTPLYGETCLEGEITSVDLSPHTERLSNLYLAPISGQPIVDITVTFV